MTILSHVACEWFLMFLMFVDAALSYALTKFARYCELQTPCLLCLRLDHFFGNEKPGCYLSLFCSNHQAEISSLVTCHIHGKLADVFDLCEECFMSTAMQSKSSSESYRFLVGKMGMDGFQSPYLNKNFVRGSLSTRPCSCCNKQWRVKSNAQRLIQLTPAGLGASKATVKPPLPRVSGRSRFSRRDSLKRMRDKFSGPMTPRRSGNAGVDALSHVGYTELRKTSDSESEVPFSDDDGSVGSSVVHQKSDSKESLDKILSDDSTRGKRSRQVSDDGSSFLDQDVQLDEDKPDGVKSLKSDAFGGRDLGELNWQQLQAKPKPSELISLEDVPPSSFPNAPSSHLSNLFALSDLMSLSTVPPQSNSLEVPLGVSADTSSAVSETTGAGLQHKVAPSVANDADLTKRSNCDVTNERREDKLAISDPPKVGKDLTLLPSTVSNHEIDSSNYRSPRAYHHHNRGDASSSDGIHKVASLEKIDPGYESLDGSSVCEIEGESVVERLKRQVEYDRRCLSSLHKELEEERNAAAIAANQAMAMITRLQEEKAALHMEALQYLRMMEEQAEYDMEALEKANDLVAEKEKELQDLEAELDFYRNNFPDGSAIDKLPGENFNLAGKNMENEKSVDADISFLILEDEKQYISESLKKLERKLQQVSNMSVSSDLSNGLYFDGIRNGVQNCEELHTDRGTELEEEINSQGQRDLSSSNGGPSHDRSVASVEDNHVDSEQNKSSINGGVIDLGTLENEISDLNERLEALETDRDFLEHACHTLQNGSEGLKFIQEIARQLQEFRKIEYKRRCLSDP